jgi:hypothetical protein
MDRCGRRLGRRPAIQFGGLRRRRTLHRLFRLWGFLAVMPSQLQRYVFVDGAGVRLLFGDAQFGEQLKNFVSLDFQLPRQLVDANLLHRKRIY